MEGLIKPILYAFPRIYLLMDDIRQEAELEIACRYKVISPGVTGAIRTTPTFVLEVLLDLTTWIRKKAMAAHLRMKNAGRLCLE